MVVEIEIEIVVVVEIDFGIGKNGEGSYEAAIQAIPNFPQQHNGSDCGMFTIMYADFISDNLNLCKLSQNDMKEYRKKVVAAILRGSLNYELLL